MDSETNGVETLDVNSVARGIGRMATDDELNEYLSKGIAAEPIDITEAFSKYSI